jgi:hypothetical protein
MPGSRLYRDEFRPPLRKTPRSRVFTQTPKGLYSVAGGSAPGTQAPAAALCPCRVGVREPPLLGDGPDALSCRGERSHRDNGDADIRDNNACARGEFARRVGDAIGRGWMGRETDPSPVSPRLVKAPAARHPLPPERDVIRGTHARRTESRLLRGERVAQRWALAAATPPLRLFVCIETGDWPLRTREGKPQRKAKNACLRATKLDERALRPLVAHPSYLFVRKSENGQRLRGEPVMKRGP